MSVIFNCSKCCFLDAPTIDIAKSSATLYSFVDNPNPVTMKCFADGRPKPEYYWQSNFGLNVSKESTYTLVKPASAELGVSYKCFAWNKVGRSRPHSVKVVKLGKCSALGVSTVRNSEGVCYILK